MQYYYDPIMWIRNATLPKLSQAIFDGIIMVNSQSFFSPHESYGFYQTFDAINLNWKSVAPRFRNAWLLLIVPTMTRKNIINFYGFLTSSAIMLGFVRNLILRISKSILNDHVFNEKNKKKWQQSSGTNATTNEVVYLSVTTICSFL